MSTEADDQPGGVTRRQIIAGASAAVAGAAVLGAVTSGQVGATAPAVAPAGGVPQALDPPIAGLLYRQIDGVAFDVAETSANRRIWQDITGVQPLTAPAWIYTALDLPVGSVVRQINAVYQGQPIANIRKRSFTDGSLTEPFAATSMTASPGGSFASSLSSVNVTIDPQASYQLRFFCAAGVSIMGVTVGYVPPPSAFVPFTGPNPRVLDTRLAGGKFNASEERVIDFSTYQALGKAVVFNLTADQPEGVGFLSAYSGDITWPGNSSLNFAPAIPNIANGVITTLGSGNKIKIRAGETKTHVIVDVIGYLL